MKWNLILITALLFFQTTVAQVAPVSLFYNVKNYGAIGDGRQVDTDAINAAITAAAAAGGGTVYFPAGTFLSYSIRLKSNIHLLLDAGCILLAADSAAGGRYDDAEPNVHDQYQDYGHSHWHNSLIWGEDLQHVSITGAGVINGAGLRRGASARRPWGNKAISLKLCRNVTLRDFTLINGGHFGILATGVDNFIIDNLTMDTNRDGIDLDCCRQVRVSNCTINAPWDDAICLKSSYALGYKKNCENITISNSQVSGFDLGSLYNGTYQRKEWNRVPDYEGPTGRIKFGTESNGGFKNISISNCVFDYCRGLALESVDGAVLEDVVIDNITMRDIVNAPIFIRLASRMRGPAEDSANGSIKRISISNINVYNADSHFASIISGVPGKNIEDVRLNNINIYYRPIDSPIHKIPVVVPENEQQYPEPAKMGLMPAYGFFVRHATGIYFNDVAVSFTGSEQRPAFFIQDVEGIYFNQLQAKPVKGNRRFILQQVSDFNISQSAGIKDIKIKNTPAKTF